MLAVSKFVDKNGAVDDETWNAFIEHLNQSEYYKSPQAFTKRESPEESDCITMADYED